MEKLAGYGDFVVDNLIMVRCPGTINDMQEGGRNLVFRFVILVEFKLLSSQEFHVLVGHVNVSSASTGRKR